MQSIQVFVCIGACLLGFSAHGQEADHPRLLLSAEDVQQHRGSWQESPLFSGALEKVRERVDAYFESTPDVPVPRDAGGGYTHEQHKRNAVAIYDAGLLHQWTGDSTYADHARALLLAYAALYPSLTEHPEKKEQSPGRLFWQSLNEAVWLVYAIQGYDAIHDTLTAGQRDTIENGLFRPMALFLSVESPQTFDKIHNHGTWATAAVGMTGYVLDDDAYVSKALLGLKRDGSAGFLKQLEELFSPDGYYNEGPYYQRYALMPFVVFAKAIEQNEPQRKIFEYRDGILKKAIYTAIQLSYAGKFFPLNDSIKDKGLDTVELDYAIAIAYGLTSDNSLLSLITDDSTLVLTSDGLRLARAKDQGLETPFDFQSMYLRDGARGDQGALSILRSGHEPGHTALVFKATSQGMGHGHFDRLAFIYYDNGNEVIADYGAARFLNVVQKNGGHYLPENNSWAKQTVAHNTLVVDEASHFGGKVKLAEATAPDRHFFAVREGMEITSAREANAYPGVSFDRTMAMIDVATLEKPLIVDVLRVHAERVHQYDLPLYYQGQFVESSAALETAQKSLAAAGKDNGYQHLWRRAQARVGKDQRYAFTWLLGNRFYTYSVLADSGLSVLMTEVGAGDPNFNLRHEPGLLLRVQGERNVTFVNLLEAHGEYNGSREFTTRSSSQLKEIRRFGVQGKDVIRLETLGGTMVTLALSYDRDPDKRHSVRVGADEVAWSGFYGLWQQQVSDNE